MKYNSYDCQKVLNRLFELARINPPPEPQYEQVQDEMLKNLKKLENYIHALEYEKGL